MGLIDALEGRRIILGSASPRRKELIAGLGIDFEVIPSDVEEEYSPETPIAEVPELLARCKALGFQRILSDQEVLITADTLVIYEGLILGKPKDYEDAKKMLRLLSGKNHLVKTGVCLRSNKKIKTFTTTSSVSFKELTDSEISYYIENYKPYDKAGSYGIQEWIGYIGITRIEGSYYNIMGLPTQVLSTELELFVKE